MKAVLRLPGDKAPQSLIQEGRQKADMFCQKLCTSLPTSQERFVTLCATYKKFDGIYKMAADNFHPDEYLARGNNLDDSRATLLMTAACQSRGSLDRIVELMHHEVGDDISLIHDFAQYAADHRAVRCNLREVFLVFSTKGAIIERLRAAQKRRMPAPAKAAELSPVYA